MKDANGMPAHIAIIMDGNGRWAKKRLLNTQAGHYAGSVALKKLCFDADAIGLKFLTVYAFSTENWKRNADEVKGLMNLIRRFVDEYTQETKDRNIKMRVIGDISRFEPDIAEKIGFLENETKNKTGLTLIMALNYGARDEILRAVRKITERNAARAGALLPLNELDFASELDTKDFPDPDLIIRTGGEKRLSNFLLYQAAYAELYFDDALWPDYGIKRLQTAIDEYNARERRFGGR